MNQTDILELHYITPIMNVASIIKHGILSHKLADNVLHHSVALQEIQDRRKNKLIPGARPLHDYANLYFDAHNPMLSKRRKENQKICVLCINPEVLDLPGVIIADRNSASDWVRFYSVKEGLAAIDKEMIFARYWTHPNNPYAGMEHKSVKCAEVLVPDKIGANHIQKVYVVNQETLLHFEQLNCGLPVSIKGDIFFQGSK